MNKIVNMYGIRQSADMGTLDIYIYDYVEGDSYNWWTGEEIKSETSASHIKNILEENPNATKINLYINSYGGEVKEGLAIYNQLNRHPAEKTVYIDGFACSIASVIAMCGDKVIMGSNALMMIHNAKMGCYGTSLELRKAAEDLDVINSSSCSTYLEKTNGKITEEQLKNMLDAETWLNASDCIKYGFADEIFEKPKEESSIQQAYHKYVAQQYEAIKQQIQPKNQTVQKNPFELFLTKK